MKNIILLILLNISLYADDDVEVYILDITPDPVFNFFISLVLNFAVYLIPLFGAISLFSRVMK